MAEPDHDEQEPEQLPGGDLLFDARSAGVVHADSSQLANLDRLDFVQCA